MKTLKNNIAIMVVLGLVGFLFTGCCREVNEKIQYHTGGAPVGPGGVTPLPTLPPTAATTAVAPAPAVQQGPVGHYVDSPADCNCQDTNSLGGSITAPMPTANVTPIVYQQPAPAPVVYIHYATPVYLNTVEPPAFYYPETQVVQSGWGAPVLNLGFQFGRGNQGGGYRGYSNRSCYPSYYPAGPQVRGGGGYRGGFGGGGHGHSGGHH